MFGVESSAFCHSSLPYGVEAAVPAAESTQHSQPLNFSTPHLLPTIQSVDNLSVFFLAQDEQSADVVMARLTAFICAAKKTLDFAVYDMRFSDPLRAQLVS